MLLSRVQAQDPRQARAFLASEGDLAGMPADFVEALLGLCRWRAIDAGESVTTAGDADGTIFAVVHGAIAFVPALGPTDANIAHILHAGEWFGIVPLIMGTPRVGSMHARNAAYLAVINQHDLETMLAAHPHWWRQIAQLAVFYGNTGANIAADLMIADSNRRLLATLLRLAGCRFHTPRDRPLEALVNQAELGAIANMSRNSVNRVLGEAARRNFIRTSYMRVELINPDAIRAIVDES